MTAVDQIRDILHLVASVLVWPVLIGLLGLAAAVLVALGARNIQVKGKTFKPQSRWLLPVEEFDPADFTTPAYRKEACDAE